MEGYRVKMDGRGGERQRVDGVRSGEGLFLRPPFQNTGFGVNGIWLL